MMPNSIDEALDRVQVEVKLGLACWAWVLTYLPDDDTVPDEIRRQIRQHPELSRCATIRELLQDKSK